MKKQRFFLAMLALMLAFGLALTSCSTIPAGQFEARNLTIDEILGQVPGEFTSYAFALEAAKRIYPRTEGVVYYTGTGGNNWIPWKVEIGYYAVTFKLTDEQETRKKFLGIF